MTAPLDSKSYPSNPTAPTAAPAGYVTPRQPDTARREPPFDTSVAEAMRGKLIELILRQIITAIFGFFSTTGGSAFTQLAAWAQGIPGVSTIVAIIKEATGVDLLTIFDGIDITNPGAVLTAIENAIQNIATGLIQQVIDALVNGLTDGNTTGNDPLSIAFAFAQQGLNIPTQIFDQIWAAIAQLNAGQQALQNAPGTVLSDDFTTAGVGNYTNIQGTLAVANGYIQTANYAIGYRTTSPASDQQGGQIVIASNQQGWSGVGICSDTAATSYALLQVYSGFQGDAVRLLTGSSPTVAVVQKQTDFISTRLADTNTFDIWYEVATNTFHVLRNGQPVFDWPDSTNILTHDASHRKGLLVSNGEDDSGRRGPGLRKANFYVRS